MLGRSEPLDCDVGTCEEGINELRLIAYNIAANSIQKCVEHSRILPETLPSFALPLCKSSGVR